MPTVYADWMDHYVVDIKAGLLVNLPPLHAILVRTVTAGQYGYRPLTN